MCCQGTSAVESGFSFLTSCTLLCSLLTSPLADAGELQRTCFTIRPSSMLAILVTDKSKSLTAVGDSLRASRLQTPSGFTANMEEKMSTMSEDRTRSHKSTEDVEEIFIKMEGRRRSKIRSSQYLMNPHIRGAPVDYSFRKIFFLSELEHRTPREYRVGIPKKTSSGKYISSSLWANYNHLTDLKAVDSLVKVSLSRPEMIAWLDVSFNEIQVVSPEILGLKNLKILYLHGNQIKFFIEVAKLKVLKKLKTLTLHGNPIEENYNYRSIVVKHLPQLVNLDFSLVTRD